MMKAILLSALLIGGTFYVAGQDAPASISTSTVDFARFEIIQPIYDRSTTFRLDKFTGTIHRLGTCPKDGTIGSSKCWKEMIVLDLPKTGGANTPRFQIFINGPLKSIFLLQTDTGQTWQYGLDPMDIWFPFIECPDKNERACLWKP